MKILFLLLVILIPKISFGQSIQIVADERTNSLIVKAPPEIQKQIEFLIKDLDKNRREANDFKVIQLVYLNASELLPLIQNVMSAYKPIQIRSSQLDINNNTWNNSIHGLVLADDRTNKLILISDKITNSNIEKIIKELDKKINSQPNSSILQLKNAKSDKITEIINNITNRRLNL